LVWRCLTAGISTAIEATESIVGTVSVRGARVPTGRHQGRGAAVSFLAHQGTCLSRLLARFFLHLTTFLLGNFGASFVRHLLAVLFGYWDVYATFVGNKLTNSFSDLNTYFNPNMAKKAKTCWHFFSGT